MRNNSKRDPTKPAQRGCGGPGRLPSGGRRVRVRVDSMGRSGGGVQAGQGFTLIELLVVISIIGVLAALMLPSLAQVKSQGKRAGCLNNVHQIGLAMQMYAGEHGAYPPAWIDAETRWMDLVKPWLNKKSGVYLCPSDQKRIAVNWDPDIFLSYGLNVFRFAEKESCFWYGVKTGLVRRPATTIILADCTPGKYYCGGGNTFTNPVVDVDYRHPKSSFVAVFGDGHAETLTTTQRLQWDVSQ